MVARLMPKRVAASAGERNGLPPTMPTSCIGCSFCFASYSCNFCLRFLSLYAFSVHDLLQNRVTIVCAINGLPHHWHFLCTSIYWSPLISSISSQRVSQFLIASHAVSSIAVSLILIMSHIVPKMSL